MVDEHVVYSRSWVHERAKYFFRYITGSNSEIVYAQVRAGDVKHSQAAIDRITKTGFTPGGDFDRGLKDTIEFFQS